MEIAALSVAGSSGAATVPVETDTGEQITTAVSVAAAAVAAYALYVGQNSTETWADECTQKKGGK